MNYKTTISITEARTKLFKIANEVQNSSVFYTLTQRGLPKVIMMSADEFESWQETLEVKNFFPDLKNDIKEAKKDYQSGNYVTLDKLAAKNFNKYAISSSNTKKNRKKIK